MRRQGWNLKRDAAEKPIVDALEAVGRTVLRVSGKGLPDLLVSVPGPSSGYLWLALEVKSKGGRLTEAQSFIPWPVVRSVDEALAVIGGQK